MVTSATSVVAPSSQSMPQQQQQVEVAHHVGGDGLQRAAPRARLRGPVSPARAGETEPSAASVIANRPPRTTSSAAATQQLDVGQMAGDILAA